MYRVYVSTVQCIRIQAETQHHHHQYHQVVVEEVARTEGRAGLLLSPPPPPHLQPLAVAVGRWTRRKCKTQIYNYTSSH